MMLFDINKKDYCILFEDIGERTLNDAATNMAKRALQKFDKPAFILCSTNVIRKGKILYGETLIRGIEKTVGPQVNYLAVWLVMILRLRVLMYLQMINPPIMAWPHWSLNEDKISLHGMASLRLETYWALSRTVTKSEGNLIYTIDNEPALEMYLRFLGEDQSSADDQLNFFDSVAVHYPFQVERENREPKMCSPIGYDKEKKALMCESDVPQGSRFRFSTPPDFDIVDRVIKMASELKNNAGADAEALLIFSCAGRFSALGPMAHQENEGLCEVWKVPMAGFYTYGEFGKAINGKHEFHSTTCSWVALKEK